jgi:hypothetical protein
MATRTETRFGQVASLGATYTNIATIAALTTANLLLSVANRTTGPVKLRAYVADTSWSTGEPTGGTLKAAIAYDLPIAGGAVIQISGIVANTTEKIIVYSDTASALDILLNGIAVT